MTKVFIPETDMECETFIDVLENRAKLTGDKIAYRFIEGNSNVSAVHSITFKQITTEAKNIAKQLLDNNIKVGDRVLLIYPPGIELLTAFYACLYVGGIAVLVYPPMNEKLAEKLDLIIQDSTPAIILTSQELKKRFGQLRLLKKTTQLPLLGKTIERRFKKYLLLGKWNQNIPWMATDNIQINDNIVLELPNINKNSLALLQYTSGSTGHPKGVMISHANILQNINQIQRETLITSRDIFASWLPPYHDMGLIATISATFAGYELTMMSPLTFLKDPYIWLKVITDYKVTLTAGPNFSYDYCVKKIKSEQKATVDLSTVRLIFNGAEPLQSKTIDKFYENFKECGFKREAFFPCYGLAEATLYVSGRFDKKVLTLSTKELKKHKFVLSDPSNENFKTLVSCGKCAQNVKIVNPKTKHLAKVNEIGEIWINSESVSSGYWNKNEVTKEIFHARIADLDNGVNYLRTGDLGYIYEDELYITGRLKDIIIIHGQNHYPQDIEHTIQYCHPKIRTGGCAAFSVESNNVENLVLVCEVEDNVANDEWDDLISAICKNIALEYELSVSAVAFIPPRQLPKTTSGKVRRQPTKSAFLKGSLPTKYVWHAPVFTENLSPKQQAGLHMDLSISPALWAKAWIEAHTSQEINPDLTFVQLGLDSIAIVEFINELGNHLGIELDPAIAWEHPSINALLKYLDENKHISNEKIPIQDENLKKKLSPEQERLYFLYMMNPNSTEYNIGTAFRIKGNLSIDLLQSSLEKIVTRHEILRTAIVNSEPVINKEYKGELTVIKVLNESDKEIRKILKHQANMPYDLSKGPLIRFVLLQNINNESILLIAAHHIIFDGTSMFIFINELFQVYEALLLNKDVYLPKLDIQYYDFAHWKKSHSFNKTKEQSLQFWRDHLQGDASTLSFSNNTKAVTINKNIIKRLSFNASSILTKKVEQFCKEQNITPFIFLFTAYQLLLINYCNQRDFVIGVPASGRNRAEVSRLLGYFVNILPIRTTANKSLSIEQLLEQNNKIINQCYKYQNVPLAELVSALKIDREPGGEVLFQTMFVMQNMIQSNLTTNDLSVSPYWSESGQLNYDLMVEIIPLLDNYRVSFSYNALLFDLASIKQITKHYRRIINLIVAKPKTILGESNVLSQHEYQQIVHEWNKTDVECPVENTLQSMFENQVQRHPDECALIIDEREVTYNQLNNESNKLAHYFIEQGLKTNDIVSINLDYSLDMIICIIAILKARGAYLCIDTDIPVNRLNELIEDSNSKWVIVDAKTKSNPSMQQRMVEISEIKTNSAKLPTSNPIFSEQQPKDSLAYLIYTSGSTGKPKGVAIEHQSICQRLSSLAQLIHSYKKFLNLSSFSFDATVLTLWLPLTTGNTAIIPTDIKQWDVKHLRSMIKRYQVDATAITPTQLNSLMMGAVENEFTSIKSLFVVGEALKQDLVVQAQKLIKNASIWNGYGPSECTILCAIFLANNYQKMNVPIGGPLPNDKFYVLNEWMLPVPVGVVGELYIGGKGLARGYLNRPELTDAKFIPNKFGTGKMYKTGDRVKWLSEGVIEYCGRIDNQIKIRGMRVELGEIEARLAQHPNIKQGVVILREDEHSGKKLVAYLVLKDTASADTSIFKKYLADYLPKHMVPADFVILGEFPINQNGKLDLKALPAPVSVRQNVVPTRDLTPIESKLLLIAKKILQNENITIKDNFFEAGGDSILSINLIIAANQENINLSVQDLLKYPTIEELATAASSMVKTRNLKRDIRGAFSLSPIQQWFIEQSFSDNNNWSQGVILTINPHLNTDLLLAVLKRIITKHPSLNMQYKVDKQSYLQEYIHFNELNLLHFNTSTHAIKDIVENMSASLNIETGDVYKIALVHDEVDGSNKLILIVHHLVIDAVSWHILLNEINYLLDNAVKNVELMLSDEAYSYKDWTTHLQQYANTDELLAEVDYWLGIKVDNNLEPRGENFISDAERKKNFEINLSKDETHILLNCHDSANKKLNMQSFLLSLLAQTYHKFFAKNELLLHLESHGREGVDGVDVNRTVGWFTALFPVLLKVDPMASTWLAMENITTLLESVPKKGIGYGILRYLKNDNHLKNTLRQQDAAKILFNYLGKINQDIETTHVTLACKPFSIQSALNHPSHWIEINAYIFNHALNIQFTFDRKYIDKNLMDSFVEVYLHLLNEFVNSHLTDDHLGNLVKINKTQDKPPLFCIHPVGGNIIGYAKLASLLENEYSAYAIQASGLQGELTPSHSIAEMARNYICKIKTIQPEGPYILLGWSMGGLIAYEMAVQLKEEGDQVAFVNLIDVEDPKTMPQVESMNDKVFFYYFMTILEAALGNKYISAISWKTKVILYSLKHFGTSFVASFLARYIIGNKNDIDPAQLKLYISMLKHDLSTIEPSQFPIKQWMIALQKANLLPQSINVQLIVNIYEVYRANFYAVKHYTPHRYDGKIIAFSVSDGWQQINFKINNKLFENFYVPGNHMNVLRNTKSLEIIKGVLQNEH